MAKSNILSYLQEYYTDHSSPQARIGLRNKRIGKFKIGVSLVPDNDVIELIPYMVP